ncbi:MAG: tRNA (adenosine(37)-N6)-threonylcarbamoyltransferase complex transferase subunit TsaD [Phycisphaeraceae bacterium]|nr:tRNA (adenosine(37)-N6)-threonylcarbamoyltransferase complex transferase subunit TsaD [Phycisphaeraceae bacterium]
MTQPTAANPSDPARLVLGIETSCDETAAAVVRDGREVRSNVIASQNELHAEFRGVVPEIASRAHCERIAPIVRRALDEAGVGADALDAVAVGNRPGLIGSLLVGVAAAKALAWRLGKPLIAVDHVHAHLYSGLMHHAGQPARDEPAWPAIGLAVSGGHTSIYRLDDPSRVHRLGGTIDDAIGEAYDKVAAILGLPFPGGPHVDRLAATGRPDAVPLPVSRLDRDGLDFSFSGLKTAVLYAVQGVPGPRAPKAVRPPDADVCASFQRAAVAAVILKLRRALDRQPECRTLLVGGGVTANSRLRAELTSLASSHGLDLRLPPMDLCLDNGAMIAGLGDRLLRQRAPDDLSIAATPTTAV